MNTERCAAAGYRFKLTAYVKFASGTLEGLEYTMELPFFTEESARHWVSVARAAKRPEYSVLAYKVASIA